MPSRTTAALLPSCTRGTSDYCSTAPFVQVCIARERGVWEGTLSIYAIRASLRTKHLVYAVQLVLRWGIWYTCRATYRERYRRSSPPVVVQSITLLVLLIIDTCTRRVLVAVSEYQWTCPSLKCLLINSSACVNEAGASLLYTSCI